MMKHLAIAMALVVLASPASAAVVSIQGATQEWISYSLNADEVATRAALVYVDRAWFTGVQNNCGEVRPIIEPFRQGPNRLVSVPLDIHGLLTPAEVMKKLKTYNAAVQAGTFPTRPF